MRIAQGDPEQAEGAALGEQPKFSLAPRRGAATSAHRPETDSLDTTRGDASRLATGVHFPLDLG